MSLFPTANDCCGAEKRCCLHVPVLAVRSDLLPLTPCIACPSADVPKLLPNGIGIDLTQVPFLWHRCTEDATKDGKNVPLLFRMATIKDVKKVKEGHLTRELWKKPEKAGLVVML